MKQVCLFILLLISGVGYAQIKIDFAKKAIEVPDKDSLQNLKEVQVIVENIPAGAYKISINKTDSFVSAGTPPALFGVLSYGEGFNSLLAGLSGYAVKTAGNLMINPTEVKKINDKNIKGIRPIDDPEVKDSVSDILLQFACKYSQDEIMPEIKNMRKKVFNLHYKFKDSVIRKTDSLIYLYNLKAIKADRFKQEADIIIQSRYRIEKEVETTYMGYYDFILPLYTSVSKCIPLATADSMLSAYKKSFFQFLDKYDSTFNETLIAKVYNQMRARSIDTFYSLPYRLKADITSFAIDITGVDAAKTPQSYSTEIILDKHPNRLWSFTSGVFMSKLVNHDFSILTNVRPNSLDPTKIDTLNYSILQETNNKMSIGINALMHIGTYFNEESGNALYLTFGPGLTLEKTPQVRAFIGAGLMLGRTNKLALSFGWTGGLVKRLSSNYSLDKTYTPAPADITRDRFKGGGFFSLGYSLWGK